MATLAPQQFSQLPMFMETKHLVNDVYKGDSALNDTDHSARFQWRGRDPQLGMSLRDWKVRDMKDDHGFVDDEYPSSYEYFTRASEKHNLPPVTVSNIGVPGRKPYLLEGHHRLAFAEETARHYLPVEHV